MKTQIIKIIPCLVAGFILSACVGAVNIPSEVADKVIKTTEPDPVIKKTAVVIIDDKEPESEPEPKPKPAPELIVIEPANPCIANPFGDTCGGEEFNDAREAVCLTERESHRCRVIIPLVCEIDSLDVLCAGDETYYPAQHSACIANKSDPRCTLTITRVCGANPFDTLCNGLAGYYPAKETTCTSEIASDRCSQTIRRICDADVFDKLCDDWVSYVARRYSHILGIGTRKSTCAYDLNGYFVTTRKSRECSFDIKKIKAYYSTREMICANEIDSERCVSTITRVCDANLFDTRCNGVEAYYSAQETACRAHSINPKCDIAIARVCSSNPQDTLCQLRNLTIQDLPRSNSIRLAGLYQKWRHQYKNEFFSPFCSGSGICGVDYYDTINIKPLNDTNTGTATYTGSVLVQYEQNRRFGVGSNLQYPPINQNIDIIADFDNNTLTYSGNLDGWNRFSRLNGSNPASLNINGKFTDKGFLTGSVKLDGSETNLVGLIGQNEVIGLFTTGSGGSIGTNAIGERSVRRFSGGFTATRQEPENTPNQ